MPKSVLNGFTLIELMVAVAIMGIIGVTILSNYRNFGADQTLKNAAADIQSQLRVAQTNALSGVKCSGSGGASWMVEFDGSNQGGTDKKSYILKCKAGSPAVTDSKTYTLPGNIEIDTINGCISSPVFPVTVNFPPINGPMTFQDSSSNPTNCLVNGSGTVTIKDTKSTTLNSRNILIKQGGSIEVN